MGSTGWRGLRAGTHRRLLSQEPLTAPRRCPHRHHQPTHERHKPESNPPNLNSIIDVASLLGETPDLAAVRREIDGIGPVARTVLDQMCCDARFTRFITAGPSAWGKTGIQAITDKQLALDNLDFVGASSPGQV